MNFYRNFVKNIGIIGTTDILVALERMVLLPIITKLLSVGDYGVWVQFSTTISLVPTFALLGLRAAVVRFLSGEKDRKKIQEGIYSVLALVSLISLIVALVLVFLSGPISNFFQTIPILVQFLAPIIFLECLIQVLLSVFQIFQEVGRYSSFTLLRTLGEAVLVVGAILLGYGLFGIVISLLAIRLLVFLILIVILFKKVGFKIPIFKQMKEYLNFSLPRVVSSLAYWMVTSSDRYMIGFFLGTIFVGYYAPAYTIGNVINFFVYPFSFMLPIVLAKSFDEKKIWETKNYLKYSLKYFLMIAVPASFGLSVLSKQLLIIFSTQEIALNSYSITPFVVLSILLYGITSIIGQPLILVKKTRLVGNISIGAAFLNFILNLIFIPKLGILGAAITTLLAYAFIFALILHYSSKELRYETNWGFIAKSVFVSIFMASLIFWYNPSGLLETIIAIVLGVCFYGIMTFLLKMIDKKEIDFFKYCFASFVPKKP